MTSDAYTARLLIAPTVSAIGGVLAELIIESCCKPALHSRGAFTIALSGGSLPSFLQELPSYCRRAGVDPQWEKWHVFLADERCVVSTDAESNLGSIQSNFTNSVCSMPMHLPVHIDTSINHYQLYSVCLFLNYIQVPIPKWQVYGINEALLTESTEAVASAYEEKILKPLLELSGGMIDCVLLGFGPDGHTCSLFPNHPLLKEQSRLVAPIDDSPKSPPSRITLTFPVLNNLSRQIIFCGAGLSKRPILSAVFRSTTHELIPESTDQTHLSSARAMTVQIVDPSPYPCGMVRTEQGGDTLVWVVDADALE
jgi:6-phosphogluconolactonase